MNRSEKYGIVGLAILLIFSIVQTTRIYQMESTLTDITRMVDSMRSEVVSGQHRVSSQVQSVMNEWKRENLWLQSDSWDYEKRESKDGSIVLKGQWSFNEMETDADVYVMVRAQDDVAAWTQLPLTNDGGLNYSASVVVSPDKSYNYQLFMDGSVKRSSELRGIPMEYYSYQAFDTMIDSIQSTTTDYRLRVALYPRDMTLVEDFMLKSARVLVYKGDSMVSTMDMNPIEYLEEIENEEVEKIKEVREYQSSVSKTWIPLFADIEMPQINHAAYHIYIEVMYVNGQITRLKVEKPFN